MTPSRTNSCSHPACLPGGALGRQNFSLGRIACEPTELQAGPVSKKHDGTSHHQWNGQILVCLSTDHGSLSTKIVLVLLTPQCAIGRLTQNRLQISLSNDAGWRENSCPEQRHGYWLPCGKGLVLSHTQPSIVMRHQRFKEFHHRHHWWEGLSSIQRSECYTSRLFWFNPGLICSWFIINLLKWCQDQLLGKIYPSHVRKGKDNKVAEMRRTR